MLRNRLKASVIYDPSSSLNILVAATYFNEKAYHLDPSRKSAGKYQPDDLALYAQAVADLDWFKLTAGVRYESNSRYAEKTVFRLGGTKVYGQWHTEVLYSQSFRSPQYEAIAGYYDPTGASTTISPQATTVLEWEVGRSITDKVSATLNVFDAGTKNPMAYFYDETNEDSYGSQGRTGSRGFESHLQYAANKTTVSLNYSFYVANNKTPLFQVINSDGSLLTDRAMLATPTDKVTLRGSFVPFPDMRLTSTANWWIGVYSATKLGVDGSTPRAERIDPYLVVNTSLLFSKVYVPWLDLQFGINNLLDANIKIPQAYNAYHAPIPGQTREVYATLIGRF